MSTMRFNLKGSL